MPKASNNTESSGSISITVVLNGKMVFWVEILDLIAILSKTKKDLDVRVYACEGNYWYYHLEKQLPYLIQDAKRY